MKSTYRSALTLAFLACSTVSPAQDSAHVASTWAFRMNPLGLVDLYGPPSAQMGVEWRPQGRFSLAVEGGYVFTYSPTLSEAPDQALSGPIVRAQVTRWRDHLRDGWMGGLSVELVYKQVSGICRDSIEPVNEPPYSLDYSIDRSVFMFRILRVERMPLAEQFWLGIHYGFGVRFRSTTSQGITDQQQADIDNRDEHGDGSVIPGYQHEVGNHWYPDLIFGIRLGVVIM